jgi:DNA repair protein RadD
MGVDVQEMTVTEWRWRKHTSRASGKEMLAVSYYGGLSDPLVEEYFPVTHGGYAGEKAVATLGIIASSAGAQLRQGITLDGAAAVMNASRPPADITYKRDGKYHRIIGRLWG